jgi:UDP-N-acetylmuramoyl-tripeptide--D-alanyl-D-alanine ligase
MSFAWTDRAVREALGLNPDRAVEGLAYTGICTDSRKVEPGSLFVALAGDRFDGHDFVPEALAQGAAGAVVSRAVSTHEASRLYPVPDTLKALGDLAQRRREALGATVVGITGSSGKTTTKDFLREALAGSARVHATDGNLNNRIGLPLTVLAAPSDAQVLVLELGTNEPGEIRDLAAVARPHLGVITTVSETHLEKLGSLEGILEEKLDLFRALPRDGLAVVGDDPPVLAERARSETADSLESEVLVVGWSERALPELRPQGAEMTEMGCYRFLWAGEQVQLQVPGRHSVQNALLALAVARALGVPPHDAAGRVGAVRPVGMRSEIRLLGSLTLLVDCYNANPQSVRAALDLLAAFRHPGPRVAVLGSMLELGEETAPLHRQVLEYALSRPLDLVVATGLLAEAARGVSRPAGGPELVLAGGLEDAGRVLLARLGGGEVVLLKASRGVAMEALLPILEERFGHGREA